jgi:membrane-bound serine protease (ClpP class)
VAGTFIGSAQVRIVALTVLASLVYSTTRAADGPRVAEQGSSEIDIAGLDVAEQGAEQNATEQVNAPADPAGRREGHLITLTPPFSDSVTRYVRRAASQFIGDAKAKGVWPVLILEIRPGATTLGQAYDLASYLTTRALNGATTVAYIPETITGHSVLVALACDEIVMAPDAEIGNAGAGEDTIGADQRGVYIEIAGKRRTVPEALALGMLDPAQEVVLAETEVSREFVLASELDDLRQRSSVTDTEVLIRANQAGVFNGREGRDLGFVKLLAVDRRMLASGLGLPREAVDDDPSFGGEWRAIRVDVSGPISANTASRAIRLIEKHIRADEVNFILVWIDSSGGSPSDSMRLANYLADLDPSQRRTVAYVESRAEGDAAFVALACDHIVVGPGATLGGAGVFTIAEQDRPLVVESLTELVARKNRAASVPAAMVDPSLQVFAYERDGDGLTEYFSEAEVAEQPDSDAWQRHGESIAPPDAVLTLSAKDAERYGVARHVAQDFAELKTVYGLENDPALVEPGWVDKLIDALNMQPVMMALLVIGISAVYFEFQVPGLGLGGLIAAVCFLLYFWSNYLGGTAGWLELVLFGAGLTFLAIEVFVIPGLGAFGVIGALCVLASLVLASQTFVVPHNQYQVSQLSRSLLIVSGGGLGALALCGWLTHYLTNHPAIARLLAPPEGHEREELIQRERVTDYDHLVGQTGKATTKLLPGGKGRFGDELVDVVTEGTVVDAGEAIEVVETVGNRVVVRVARR